MSFSFKPEMTVISNDLQIMFNNAGFLLLFDLSS